MKYIDVKEDFGRKLIEEVRDRTLEYYRRLSMSELRSQRDRMLSEKIQLLTDKERELLQEVVFCITDLSLHNIMFLFESEPPSGWRIILHPEEIDLAEVSDGLCGELYSETGWISRYSKYESTLND